MDYTESSWFADESDSLNLSAADDLGYGRAGREGSQYRSPVPAQARGAERVGNRLRGVPQQQRTLETQREKSGDSPRPERQLLGVAELGVSRLTASSKRGSAPRASSISAVTAASVSDERPIARSTSSAMTLPEPSQIELSGDCR